MKLNLKILLITALTVAVTLPGINSNAQEVKVNADTSKVSQKEEGAQKKVKNKEQNKNQQGNISGQQAGQQTDQQGKTIKQVKGARPDMSKMKGARPNITRPSGSGIPKGVGKPGGAGRMGSR